MLKKHKLEIQRWLENTNEPDVWVKNENDKIKTWKKQSFEDCSWDKNCHYIVDDKYAELRKIQIDKPDTKFEYWDEYEKKWLDTYPLWDSCLYRIKPTYPIFKVSGKGTNEEFVVKFTGPTVGEVVFAMPDSTYTIGHVSDGWYEHNRKDCWEDVSYNPKRRLYDKQPIVCWDNNMETVRIVGFYDIENDGVFNIEGCRDGFEYDNYTPYPHPDDKFIIEMYRKLEK